MAKKVRVKFDTDKFIRIDQAAEFITESNAIENIHFDIDLALATWPQQHSPHVEIDGQIKAMIYMLKQHKLKLSILRIVEMHTKLMTHLLDKNHLGIRTGWVRIGSRLCPAPIAVRPMLEKWCEKVNALKDPTEDQLWQTHLAYEYIHPFNDGNGRSGRLLWLWLRLKFGYPYKCVYNSTKYERYYPQFDAFSWETWLAS